MSTHSTSSPSQRPAMPSACFVPASGKACWGTIRNGLLLALVLTGAATLGACAAGQPSQSQPAPVTPATSQQPAARIYYTQVDGLKLYKEPKASKSSLTQLPLHQKVYRYKIERGYAYVKVDGTELMGWVNNGRLIWKLPAKPKDVPVVTPQPGAQPVPEPQPSIEAPSRASVQDAPAVIPEPAAEPVVEPQPQPLTPPASQHKKIAPSVFDTF